MFSSILKMKKKSSFYPTFLRQKKEMRVILGLSFYSKTKKLGNYANNGSKNFG